MKLPKIKEGEIIVLKAEKKTGIILNNDNSPYLQEGNNYYTIFSNIDEVKEYINSIISTDIEFILYDSTETYITTI